MPAIPEHYRPHIITLLRQRLSAGGQARLRVQGSSMLPLLRPGDTVCIAPCCPEHVRPGEIIIFQRGNTLITHRVLACSAHSLQTRGDSCRFSDAPIQAADILGRVVAIERDGSRHPIKQRAWHRLYRVPGMLAMLTMSVQRVRERQFTAVAASCRSRPLLVLLACAHIAFRLLLRCCWLLAARRLPG